MSHENIISEDKLASQAFNTFVGEYFSYNTCRFTGLRIGQAFLNEFYPNDVFPELFYTQSPGEALRLIEENYVDYSS